MKKLEKVQAKTVDERYLFEAVEKGDVDLVENVLSSEHVEVTQEFGFQYIVYDDKPLKGHWTMLHVAVLKQYIKIVVQLLDHGADINSQFCEVFTQDGLKCFFGSDFLFSRFTPIMLAAAIGNEQLVTLLLERGAEVEVKSSDDGSISSALFLSFANGRRRISEMLIKRSNEDCLSRESRNGAPLFFYACCGGQDLVDLWEEEMTDKEKRSEAMKLSKRDDVQRTALHWAMMGVQIDVAGELVFKGFDLLQKDKNDWSVTHYVCYSRQKTEEDKVVLLKWLLAENTQLSLEDKTSEGLTCLSLACLSENFELAKALIEMGSKCLFDIQTGSRILENAIYKKDLDCAVNLSKLGVRFFGLETLKGKFLEKRKFCDERKVFDSFVVEKVLLAEMSGVMHWACLLGSVLSLKILLNQKDANVNEVDEDGRTPIMYCRYSDSLKFLAIQGANMEACDKDGNSLLHVLGENEYLIDENDLKVILEFLTNYGLSSRLENKIGKTPLDIFEGELKGILESRSETFEKKTDAWSKDMREDTSFQEASSVTLTTRIGTLKKDALESLCALMDTVDPLGNDWRKLWTELLNEPIISEESRVLPDSTQGPTHLLLTIWSQRVPECTVGYLMSVLRNMRRNDAADVLDSMILKSNSDGLIVQMKTESLFLNYVTSSGEKTITSDGLQLELPDKSCSLLVPKDAVDDSVVVSVRVFTDHGKHEENTERSLSNVIELLPHGLQLKKKAVLKFKHNFVFNKHHPAEVTLLYDGGCGKMTTLCHITEINQTVAFSGGSATLLLDQIVLKMKSFCRVCGESGGSCLNLCASVFLPSQLDFHGFESSVIMRVPISTKSRMKRITKREMDTHYSLHREMGINLCSCQIENRKKCCEECGPGADCSENCERCLTVEVKPKEGCALSVSSSHVVHMLDLKNVAEMPKQFEKVCDFLISNDKRSNDLSVVLKFKSFKRSPDQFFIGIPVPASPAAKLRTSTLPLDVKQTDESQDVKADQDESLCDTRPGRNAKQTSTLRRFLSMPWRRYRADIDSRFRRRVSRRVDRRPRRIGEEAPFICIVGVMVAIIAILYLYPGLYRDTKLPSVYDAAWNNFASIVCKASSNKWREMGDQLQCEWSVLVDLESKQGLGNEMKCRSVLEMYRQKQGDSKETRDKVIGACVEVETGGLLNEILAKNGFSSVNK